MGNVKRTKSVEKFKFLLDQNVKMRHSDEAGVVIGRAEYSCGIRSYLVIYKAGDGRQIENWWEEDKILKAEQD